MKDLDEAVQHICHIEQRNEKGDYYTFIAIDPFSSHIFGCPENLSYHTEPTVYLGNNEDQLQKIRDLMDDQHPTQWKYDNLSPFLIHENPQFIVQKDTVTLNIIEKNQTVEQYYYMTNDNQFMLVYPNYENLQQKNDVIF